MDPKLLREATRPEHEATETTVPLMGTGLTREHYLDVLQRFHGIICAWDAFAKEHAPGRYRSLVDQRRRCGSLEEDIRFVGGLPETSAADGSLRQQMLELVEGAVPAQDLAGEPEPLARDARFLGAMYVIEGSTLGGQYIAKHVEDTLQMKKGEGDRYFRGYGDQTMPMWREFQQELRNVPDDRGPEVIEAAKGMFAIFGRWMQSFEPLPVPPQSPVVPS